MPVTVEGKLELFKKVLFEHIEEDWSERRSSITKEMEQRLEEEKKDFDKKIKAIIDDRESRAQAKRKMIISKIQSDSDQQVMKKKEELLSDVTDSLKRWSREFIKTEGYKTFLQKNIEQCFEVMNGRNLLLKFTSDDMNALGTLIKQETDKFGSGRSIELVESNEDIIGGFMAEDKDSGVLADFTIKTLVDEGRELMGKLLYEKLDEVLKA